MSELLGVSDAKKNYPKLRARIEIRQHVSPQKLWHWSVIYDSGHVFSVSESFTDMDQAIADVALYGGLALRRAMTPNIRGKAAAEGGRAFTELLYGILTKRKTRWQSLEKNP